MTLRNSIISVLLVLGLCWALPAAAGVPRQSIRSIRTQVARLLRAQTASLPGKAHFHIGEIDPRLNLPACAVAPHAFVPPGARLWGNTTIAVRCAGARPWQIYVPVTVAVLASVVVANRPLGAGQRVARADLALQQVDLTQLSAGVVTDPAQAVGRTLTLGVAAGEPLRLGMLRAPAVIRRGETVTVRTQGPGFSVSTQGRALADAAAGGLAQVRVASGRTISGTAEAAGIVEVQY